MAKPTPRLLPALLVSWGAVAFAQDLPFTLAAGGGTSSAGPYGMSDTIGQAAIGSLASAAYACNSGFWETFVSAVLAYSPTLATHPGAVLDIPQLKLTAKALSPDGGVFAVVGVGSPTARLGTAFLGNSAISYTPPVGFSGTDAFNYAILGQNGETAIGSITVLVAPGNPLAVDPRSGPLVTNGQFLTSFAGIPGLIYTIESTDTLSDPHWQKKLNLLAPSIGDFDTGVFDFLDPLGGSRARFYRAVYPAY